MITIDRLRYFLASAKLAHVGQAAKKMNVSPSVVSSAIKVLEDLIGENLFVRARNRIELNSKGRELATFVQTIIDEIEKLENGTWHSGNDLTGHFKLGGSHFLMQEFLIPGALELEKLSPKVTLEFVSLDSGVAFSQVKIGILDAALVFRSSHFEKVNETICYEDSFKLFVKNNHPILRSPSSRVVERLNALPAVTFRTSTGANFWEQHPAFNKLGIDPKHRFFYDDTASCIQLIKKTDGWAFLPSVIGKRCRSISELEISNKISAPVNISLIVANKPRASILANKIYDVLKNSWD